jgi:actin, other eukaryote
VACHLKPQNAPNQLDYFIGDAALERRCPSNFQYHNPIEFGLIKDFDIMEKIWEHTFYREFRSVPEGQNLFMTEDVGNTNSKRRKTTQIVFETFNVPGFFLEQSSVLSLYATGKTTGTVLKSGHTKNHVCCIDGGSILSKVEISYLGGRDVSKKLGEMVNRFIDFNIVETNRMKEDSGFVSMNPFFESVKKEYVLMDGEKIWLEDETYLAPEILFDYSSKSSVQRLIQNCIGNQNKEVEDYLWKNIIVSGGGSMFKGFSERLSKELKYLTSNLANVISPDNRRYSNWSGASILAKLDSFENLMVCKEQYNEHGESIIESVCLNNVELIHRSKLPSSLQNNINNFVNTKILTEIKFQFD